ELGSQFVDSGRWQEARPRQHGWQYLPDQVSTALLVQHASKQACREIHHLSLLPRAVGGHEHRRAELPAWPNLPARWPRLPISCPNGSLLVLCGPVTTLGIIGPIAVWFCRCWRWRVVVRPG